MKERERIDFFENNISKRTDYLCPKKDRKTYKKRTNELFGWIFSAAKYKGYHFLFVGLIIKHFFKNQHQDVSDTCCTWWYQPQHPENLGNEGGRQERLIWTGIFLDQRVWVVTLWYFVCILDTFFFPVSRRNR